MIDFESKRSGNAYYHTIDIHNLNFGQHTHRSYEMIFIKAGIHRYILLFQMNEFDMAKLLWHSLVLLYIQCFQ